MAGPAMLLSGFPNTLHDCVRLSEDDHREILTRMKRSVVSENEALGGMFNNVLSLDGRTEARGLR